jgi:hypothetical protein
MIYFKSFNNKKYIFCKNSYFSYNSDHTIKSLRYKKDETFQKKIQNKKKKKSKIYLKYY